MKSEIKNNLNSTREQCFTAVSSWHSQHAASCASSPKGCEPLASAKSEGAEGKWWGLLWRARTYLTSCPADTPFRESEYV